MSGFYAPTAPRLGSDPRTPPLHPRLLSQVTPHAPRLQSSPESLMACESACLHRPWWLHGNVIPSETQHPVASSSSRPNARLSCLHIRSIKLNSLQIWQQIVTSHSHCTFFCLKPYIACSESGWKIEQERPSHMQLELFSMCGHVDYNLTFLSK